MPSSVGQKVGLSFRRIALTLRLIQQSMFSVLLYLSSVENYDNDVNMNARVSDLCTYLSLAISSS